MIGRGKDPTLPWWIEHGPLPACVPIDPDSGTTERELHLRVERAFAGQPFTLWHSTGAWDRNLDLSGEQMYVLSRAPVQDLVPGFAAQGFVERHREMLTSGVMVCELLISLEGRCAAYGQVKAWLGDTPLHRAVFERCHAIERWRVAAAEDKVLLHLLYGEAPWAVEILAYHREDDGKFQHAVLDQRARELGLDAQLAELRALAAKIDTTD
jgi:hypothetical protein